jgi:hypothetical protein
VLLSAAAAQACVCRPLLVLLQGSWYTWVSVLLFVVFAGFWMSRYSKAMKLFPVLCIMPLIQITWVLFSIISGSIYYQVRESGVALAAWKGLALLPRLLLQAANGCGQPAASCCRVGRRTSSRPSGGKPCTTSATLSYHLPCRSTRP